MNSRQADVVVPVYRDVPGTRACLESVFAHSGDALGQLIVVNDCSPDPEMAPMLDTFRRAHSQTTVMTNATNLGFVASANLGLFLRKRDVVLLNSDTLVTPGWLRELLEVAYAHDRVSCVCPLSNNATICSVPLFAQETKADDLPFDELGISESQIPPSTDVPTGVGFCLLLKDSVINMVGALDPAFGRGYNEENDWVMRAQALGFKPVRANRAFVYHLGSVSFGDERTALERNNGKLLRSRHPHYLPQVQAFVDGPEARVGAHLLQRRMREPSVCLDLRHVGVPATNGTDNYALSLLHGLRAHTPFKVSACVANSAQERLLKKLDVPTIRETDPLGEVQVVHRPAQVFDPRDAAFLLNATAHTVLTYQDLIAFRVPAVFPDYDAFARYRALSYATLQSSQRVLAISEHCRREIVQEFHLAPEKVRSVLHGVAADHFAARDERRNARLLAEHRVDGPFLFYAGTDFPHKNLKLLLAAYALFRSRWPEPSEAPGLVLVGPHVASSLGIYSQLRQSAPPGVQYLGAVSSDMVRALYQEARAFVFLSAYEGFGLPILEAMAAGTPVVCSSLTSLPEVGGDAALYVRDFSDDEIARLLLEATLDQTVRQRLIARGRARVASFKWEETARQTAEVYLEAIEQPIEASLFSRRMFSTLLTNARRY